MVNAIIILEIVLNLIAIADCIWKNLRSKKTIQKESRTDKDHNPEEERQRLEETRIAQIGVLLLLQDCQSDYRQYFLSIGNHGCPSKIG